VARLLFATKIAATRSAYVPRAPTFWRPDRLDGLFFLASIAKMANGSAESGVCRSLLRTSVDLIEAALALKIIDPARLHLDFGRNAAAASARARGSVHVGATDRSSARRGPHPIVHRIQFALAPLVGRKHKTARQLHESAGPGQPPGAQHLSDGWFTDVHVVAFGVEPTVHVHALIEVT
jgi:hypothetical protein